MARADVERLGQMQDEVVPPVLSSIFTICLACMHSVGQDAYVHARQAQVNAVSEGWHNTIVERAAPHFTQLLQHLLMMIKAQALARLSLQMGCTIVHSPNSPIHTCARQCRCTPNIDPHRAVLSGSSHLG